MIIETRSAQETFQLGKELGEKAYPGQVFTLTGDLGVGKTVFTQGFAAGLGITEPVNSPTFTIVQVYEEGRLPFYHFDVYRLQSRLIVRHLRSYRCMRKADCRFIILTYIALEMWKKWMKWDSKIM